LIDMSNVRQLGGAGRLIDRTVTEVRRYMEVNGLEAGHKLPPERILIEQLGVSRSSVREAMRVLSTLGLIEVRHGDGTYVASGSDNWTLAEVRWFDASEEHALCNLIETRLSIELALVAGAVRRATDDDLDRLEEIIDSHEAALRDAVDYEWEPLTFELALAEICGNSWLYEIEVNLQQAWCSLSGGLRASVGRHTEWNSEHRAILASLRSRNTLQAQRLVMSHVNLERFEEDLHHRDHSGASRQTGVSQ
jgi:GntR family transcriptional repressor for pyruvate dehydrogenase complex